MCLGAGRLTPGPDSIHLSVTIYDAYEGIRTLEGQPRVSQIHGPCPVSTVVCLNAETSSVTKPSIVWGPYLLSGPNGPDSYAQSWRVWASSYQNWQIPYRYPAPNSNWWIYQGMRATGTMNRAFDFAPFQAPGYGN